MENSCKQFFDEWKNDSNSGMDPRIRPQNLSDISESERDILIKAIDRIPENNMIFLILGFQLIRTEKFSEIYKIIEGFPNNIYMMAIEPDPAYFEPGATEERQPIDEYVFGYWKSRYGSKIVDTSMIQSKFPLAIYSSEYHRGSLTSWSSGTMYSNSLDVIKRLINYNGELVILSSITKLCYRSFKYIIDIRNKSGKRTNVIITHDAESNCDHTNPIFPKAYTNCWDFKPKDRWPNGLFDETNPRFEKAAVRMKKYYDEFDKNVETYTRDNFGVVGGGNNNYRDKYLKYKNKYLQLKKQLSK